MAPNTRRAYLGALTRLADALSERTLRGYAGRGDEVGRRVQVAPIRWEQADAAALDVEDLNAEDRTLTIRRSKTDQEGAGAVFHLGRPTLERVRAWLGASGVKEGALFRRVGKGGRIGGRLTSRSLRRIIQACARVAGIEGRVSGHSLRVGSAQSLAAAGASLVEMQREGRWKSPEMPGLYTRHQVARRGATARLRYKE